MYSLSGFAFNSAVDVGNGSDEICSAVPSVFTVKSVANWLAKLFATVNSRR